MRTGVTTGELARVAGVSTDTLRHYESKGVIAPPPRAANGYRLYPPETLPRVQLIRRALGIGFTLEELAPLLRSRDRGGAPCAEVRQLAARKLGEVEERLGELIALRDTLVDTLKVWDARLTSTPAGKRARLLESLQPNVRNGATRPAAFSTSTKRKEPKR